MKHMVICRGCSGNKTVDIYENGEYIGTRNCASCDGKGAMEISWSELLPNIFYAYEILECIDTTEYNNLTDGQKAGILLLLSCGLVDLNDNKAGKTRLWNWFGAESTTVENLTELIG